MCFLIELECNLHFDKCTVSYIVEGFDLFEILQYIDFEIYFSYIANRFHLLSLF